MASTAINWQDCVKQSNNKPDLAQELLDMFALELPTLKQHIVSAHQKKDRSNLEHHVHKLHGATCYCGTQKLKSLLHNLEPQIKKLSDAELSRHMQSVLLEIDRVMRSLKSKDYR